MSQWLEVNHATHVRTATARSPDDHQSVVAPRQSVGHCIREIYLRYMLMGPIISLRLNPRPRAFFPMEVTGGPRLPRAWAPTLHRLGVDAGEVGPQELPTHNTSASSVPMRRGPCDHGSRVSNDILVVVLVEFARLRVTGGHPVHRPSSRATTLCGRDVAAPMVSRAICATSHCRCDVAGGAVGHAGALRNNLNVLIDLKSVSSVTGSKRTIPPPMALPLPSTSTAPPSGDIDADLLGLELAERTPSIHVEPEVAIAVAHEAVGIGGETVGALTFNHYTPPVLPLTLPMVASLLGLLLVK